MQRFACPKIMYLFWIITFTKEDLKKLDKETRTIMIEK